MTFKSIVFTIAFILIQSALFCQNDLSKLSYEQLKDSIFKYQFKGLYLKAYTSKANKENNIHHQAYAHVYASYSKSFDEALKYCDSVIKLTKDVDDNDFPALGYMLKGYYYYDNGQDLEALKLYKLAYQYALERNNVEQLKEIKDFFAALKTNLGFYHEPLKLAQKKYIEITSKPNFKSNNQKNYFHVLDDLSTNYLRAKKLDSASIFIKEGLLFSIKVNNLNWYPDFLLSSSTLLFYQEKYKRSLDSLKKVEPLLSKNISLSDCYYYQAKAHQKLDRKNLSIIYFNKVDSIYLRYNNPTVELKDVYKNLYDYHLETGNKQKQLETINKLIKIDTILDNISITVNSQSINDYEIPKLKQEKKKLLEELNKEHNKTNYIIAISVIVLIILITILIKLNLDKKQLKTRFDNIVKNQDAIASKTEVTKETVQESLNISKDVIDSILDALTHFEKNKEFLNNQTTLASLAKQFNTNSVYLSKIINHYKGVSLSNYLTNLRIDYCVSELRHNSTLRNYTIKAIAEEMGFRNSESFSKAFKKQTGLNPSYYIKELNKLEEIS